MQSGNRQLGAKPNCNFKMGQSIALVQTTQWKKTTPVGHEEVLHLKMTSETLDLRGRRGWRAHPDPQSAEAGIEGDQGGVPLDMGGAGQIGGRMSPVLQQKQNGALIGGASRTLWVPAIMG